MFRFFIAFLKKPFQEIFRGLIIYVSIYVSFVHSLYLVTSASMFILNNILPRFEQLF